MLGNPPSWHRIRRLSAPTASSLPMAHVTYPAPCAIGFFYRFTIREDSQFAAFSIGPLKKRRRCWSFEGKHDAGSSSPGGAQ
jgi:hypothetical protein